MSEDDAQQPRPKLPLRQLTILAVARFAEPIATTSIFPYLPQMVRDFGVSENEVAKWAGITSAVFSVFQSLAAVPWGKVADRWGRKPSLIVGLLCTMTCFIVWGMSTSLAMAISVRAVQGASNGNVGIIRTMVAELVPEKELQPRAFSIMPLVWSLGSVAGPAFGGFFAEPAKQYPALFGGVWYFEKFPYALPNLIATVFFLVSVTSATFFLQETLATKRDQRDWGLRVSSRLSRALRDRPAPAPQRRRHSFVDGEATAPLLPSAAKADDDNGAPPPGFREIFTRQVVLIMLAYFFLAFHSVAYDQNVTVFLHYPVVEHTPENTRLPFYFTGGFGLNTGRIGSIFMLYGITCGLVQFLLFSPMVTRWGVLRCYRACCVVMPVVYILTPYTCLFSTPAARLAALAAVLALKAFSIIVAFPAVTILLTNSAPSLRILGTLNGFVTMFAGLGRAIGPATTGWAFSWGVARGYVVTAYFFLAAVAVCGALPLFWFVEGDGPSGSSRRSSSVPSSADASIADDGQPQQVPSDAALLSGSAVADSYSDDGRGGNGHVDDEQQQQQPAETQPLLAQHRTAYGSTDTQSGTTGRQEAVS
ncbi:Major Facilitator Superfamily protein [Moelleriella libera RCEF 2490]|uniref:Major Facilitator Superfamily protein n=1 Tax=Moelleriella libera RCEF 2490 TaxID=1081109 RepID=A0A168ADL0_9HYPO|nr:Major Facilitator Superfamily protein [Moelleriella libera RCEF 2490]